MIVSQHRWPKIHFLAGLAGIALLAATDPAVAATITFTHAGTASSGSIGGVSFGPTDFVITATADTHDRQSFDGGFFVFHRSANIDLQGVGSYGFDDETRTFVNNRAEIVGFSRFFDLFDGPTSSSFASYDLRSSIGPVSGRGEVLQWDIEDVATTGGDLFLTSGVSPASFQAVAAPIPLPAGAALMLTALAGLALVRRRLGRAAGASLA